MSILTNPELSAILFLSIAACYTDIKYRKIYNSTTFPFIILGIFYSTYSAGFSGFGNSISAVLVAFLLFGWMFYFRQIGAGDVKLLMAFGSWGGIAFTIHTALLSIFVGALFGLIILIKQKKIFLFLRKMQIFIYGLIFKEISSGLPEIDKKLTFPFGVAISIAAFIEFVFQPISKIGGGIL